VPSFGIQISRTVAAAAPPDERIVVRLRGGDARKALSAAALDLGYGAERLTLESCRVIGNGLDGGYCNATSGPGPARLVFVAVAGIAADQTLAELTFRPRNGATFSDAELSGLFNLTAQGVYDGAGKGLGWRLAPPQFTRRPPADNRLRLYLPSVFRQ
jgi:hypothetical protein